MTLPARLKLDEDGRLASEATCVGCGYVLRGLRPVDRCPECGREVGASLAADRLLFADPRWLGRVRSGFGWLLGGFIAAVMLGSCDGSYGPAMAMGGEPWMGWVVVGMFVVGRLLPEAAWAVGVWLASSAEPEAGNPGDSRGRDTRWRTVARWGEVVRLGLMVVALLVLLPAAAGMSDGAVLPVVSEAVLAVGMAAGVVSTVGLLFWFAGLASRMPRRPVAKQLRVAAWVVMVVGLLWAVFDAAQQIGMGVILQGVSTVMQTAGATAAGPTAAPASPELPPIQVPPPPPAGSPLVTSSMLPDGTQRTVQFPGGATGPLPGATIINDVMPDGRTRTFMSQPMPDGGTQTTDTVNDNAGTSTTTTTNFDAVGNVTSQTTSSMSMPVFFSDPGMMVYAVAAYAVWALVALARMGVGIWALVLAILMFAGLGEARRVSERLSMVIPPAPPTAPTVLPVRPEPPEAAHG